MGVRVAGHDHEAGGRHIKAVNDAGAGIFCLHAGFQTVLLVGSASAHGEQLRRLVQNDQMSVDVDDSQRTHRRIIRCPDHAEGFGAARCSAKAMSCTSSRAGWKIARRCWGS